MKLARPYDLGVVGRELEALIRRVDKMDDRLSQLWHAKWRELDEREAELDRRYQELATPARNDGDGDE